MKKSQKTALEVGAGVAALAAAAAGVYFMTGKHAKNRKKVGKWAQGFERDVVKQLKGVRNASEASYKKVVDEVARNYKQLKKVNPSELSVAAGQLKGHWNTIRRELQSAAKSVRKVSPVRKVKRVIRKVTKKSRKKRR